MNNTEKKIFSAFHEASKQCSSGDKTPTEALAKAAAMHDLNPEMTRRSGEMLNIFLTQSFLKSASDKAASFPTADIQEALKEVFTNSPAKQIKTASHVGGYKSTKKASANDTKLSFIGGAKMPDPYLRDMDDLVRHMNGFTKEAKVKVESARYEMESDKQASFAIYKSLVDLMQNYNYYSKFAAFEAQCISEYGPQVRTHLDLIAKQIPKTDRLPEDELPKRAIYFEGGKENDLFDKFIHSMSKCAKSEAAWRDATDESNKLTEQVSGIYRQSVGLPLRKKANDFLLDGAIPSPLQSTRDIIEGRAGAERSATESAHEKQIERMYKRPLEEKKMEMQNVRRAAILKDIMINDDIVSSLDPDKVQDAYNGLLMTSPESTLNRSMVVSYLRSAGNQQALDPFTAKQLADTSNVLLKNKVQRDNPSALVKP